MNKHTNIKQHETNSSIKIIEIDSCFTQIWNLKGFKITMMNMFDGEKQWKFGDSQKRNRLSRKIKVDSLGEKNKRTSKHIAVKVKVTQSCPTFCDPVDYTVHGILQARILERVAFPFSRASSQPRDRAQVSHTAGSVFASWANREAQEYWSG